jgi:hypothetical protein
MRPQVMPKGNRLAFTYWSLSARQSIHRHVAAREERKYVHARAVIQKRKAAMGVSPAKQYTTILVADMRFEG